MQIEITAQNIDDYGLDELTGNDKETLLRRAAEAAGVGQVLYFKLPDHRQTQNVFDRFKGPNVDIEHAEQGRTNPIEGETGDSSDAGVQTVEYHTCELPTESKLGDEFECRWCRKKYYAEEVSGALNSEGSAMEWVLLGELE